MTMIDRREETAGPASAGWVGIFIVGAARSGSTWLQALLGAHPRVATTVELSVFHRFVGPDRKSVV